MAVALLPQTPWRVVVLSRGSTALFPSRIPLPHVLTRNPLHTGFASHTKEWRSGETRAGIHIDRRRHFDELWRRQEVIFLPFACQIFGKNRSTKLFLTSSLENSTLERKKVTSHTNHKTQADRQSSSFSAEEFLTISSCSGMNGFRPSLRVSCKQ
jgi:hypothetical protein